MTIIASVLSPQGVTSDVVSNGVIQKTRRIEDGREMAGDGTRIEKGRTEECRLGNRFIGLTIGNL